MRLLFHNIWERDSRYIVVTSYRSFYSGKLNRIQLFALVNSIWMERRSERGKKIRWFSRMPFDAGNVLPNFRADWQLTCEMFCLDLSMPIIREDAYILWPEKFGSSVLYAIEYKNSTDLATEKNYVDWAVSSQRKHFILLIW